MAEPLPLPRLGGAGAVEVDGRSGRGVTSLVLSLLAEPSHESPVAYLDVRGMVSPVAAAECGCDLDRLVFVRATRADQWSRALAYLLDGVVAVAAEVPGSVRAADLRTLAARARTRNRLLVLAPLESRLPSGVAASRVVLVDSVWSGPQQGRGALTTRRLQARIEGKLARGASEEGWLGVPSLTWESEQGRRLRAVR